ncbi:MAG: hypothetical protein JWN75_561 [Candidatus Saccharibacteria bacterium]|nr:hypothetical protein [Candidatus Saccharibacteria bacterium]
MTMVVKSKKTVNEVRLDKNGIVRSIYHGSQNAAGLLRTITKIMKIMQKLLDEDKPVKLLIDIRDLNEYDQPSRLVEMQARTTLPFWKMAFVTTGKQHPAEQVSRMLTSMSGRKQEIRYFQREDDAIGWLSFMRKSM